MANSPLVSVIIPAYNCEAYISEALESVYAQTYNNWEIIVIDDGSTDGTQAILKRHAHRIRYYYQFNKGTAAARNAGLSRARGELIAFLDNDDVWCAEKLEWQVRTLQRFPECGLVFTDGIAFDEHGERSASLITARLESWIEKCQRPASSVVEGWLANELFFKNEISSATAVMIRRGCVDVIGWFDESIRIADDFDFWLRLARRYRVALIRQRLYKWRVRNDSQSGPVDNREHRWNVAMITVIEKHLATVPQEIESKVRGHLAHEYWACGRAYFDQDRFVDARRMFVGCFRHGEYRIAAMAFVFICYLPPWIIARLRALKRQGRALAGGLCMDR